MRITYRGKSNKEYWEKRWAAVPVDEPMDAADTYPLRYALMAEAMAGEGARILEAGCGAGRIMRFFKNKGCKIEGMDFVASVIETLKQADPDLDVEQGNITGLRYADESFDCVLAFGLYHNLPPDILERALAETHRVLAPGGVLCASFRCDNMTTRIMDRIRERESPSDPCAREFHKLNLTEAEFRAVLRRGGFCVDSMHYVVNMPVLYKFCIFRHKRHKVFDEHLMRREGARLNAAGSLLQAVMMRVMPGQYCNIFVALVVRD
ncbi:class I SAM-dependent methyltransferase [Desulfocurvus sp. DL9XJH121]